MTKNIKSSHLFVVKDKPVAPGQAKLVSAEGLTAEQRRAAERYVELCQCRGVLIGALLGLDGWDIRPLLLEQERLVLVRFSDPGLSLYASKFASLKALLTLGSRAPGTAWGEVTGQLWFKRSYYQVMLDEAGEIGSSLHPVQAAQQLVREVAALHRAGHVHGHICRANIALSEGSLVLVDPGFFSFSPLGAKNKTDAAPELLNGQNATAATDVFGLGLVLKTLLGQNATDSINRQLELATQAESAVRPSLGTLETLFAPGGVPPAASGAPKLSLHPGVRSGKLVKPEFLVPYTTTPKQNEPGTIPESRPADPPALAASKSSSPEAKDPDKPISTPGARSSWAWVAVSLVACLVGIVFFKSNFFQRVEGESYSSAWLSSQPSRMESVARAAVEGQDSEAQAVIIGDVLQGNSRPLIRMEFLRTALNPAWEKELASTDRTLAIALATSKLLPNLKTELPPISDAHPGILLSLVADVALDNPGPEISKLQIVSLTGLPAPFGTAFTRLYEQGVTTFDDRSARALAGILAGQVNENSLNAFFGDDKNQFSEPAKLEALLELSLALPTFAQRIYTILAKGQGTLSERVRWFGAEEIAQWDKVTQAVRLGIVVGKFDIKSLSFEQSADLLRFPETGVKNTAETTLGSGSLGEKNIGTIAFLAKPDSPFSRFQTVSLLAALRLQGEAGYTFLSRWFSTRPDPTALLQLLKVRQNIASSDPLAVETARYLKKIRWQPGPEGLELMLGQAEPLIRALAYAKLSSGIPEQKKILESALETETNARLKEHLKAKLEMEPVPLVEAEAEEEDFIPLE